MQSSLSCIQTVAATAIKTKSTSSKTAMMLWQTVMEWFRMAAGHLQWLCLGGDNYWFFVWRHCGQCQAEIIYRLLSSHSCQSRLYFMKSVIICTILLFSFSGLKFLIYAHMVNNPWPVTILQVSCVLNALTPHENHRSGIGLGLVLGLRPELKLGLGCGLR